MKSHGHIKSRGPTRINPQQVAFEQKRKMVLALNKLADRDTYQIAVDELEKTAECLTPDRVAPFLSCILDTDSEQKSTVRKECIRLMGTLVRFHEDQVGPHLGKMMASIVKRLKDPDSVVRDACVETVGVLASKLSNCESESGGVFVLLVKPLFEALGEQNKQVQSGSALCLARVIDNTNDPPISILHRMLAKTIKLLKNPHFVAKPAVVELNRSIILAGGAPTHDALTAAMASIQEALKNSDWTTRKAASVALGEIASGGGALLGSFKASCIRSLESCRFDKVKPVRDTVMQALHNWRVAPGSDTPDASEVGSSIKENFCDGGDYNDLTSASGSGKRDVLHKVAGPDTNKRRVPLSVRKACEDNIGHNQHSRADDWHIVIADSKTRNISLANLHNDESECSSVTKTSERMSTDATVTQDIGYEYVPMDDKQECFSASNNVMDDFENKFVSVSHVSLGEGDLLKPSGRGQRFSTEEVNDEEQMYLEKARDRRSLDSTVTESSSQIASGCCLQMANEMHCIRKQLLEIETKQSALMDLMQMFTRSTMDNLSMIQSKVLDLERVVDKIADGLVNGGRYSSDSAISKPMKHGYNVASPRISTSTPRSSVDVCSRKPSMLSAKKLEKREQETYGRSRADNFTKDGMDMWTSSTSKTTVTPTMKGIQMNTARGRVNTDRNQMRKSNTVDARQIVSESRNSLWQRVKGFLSDRDFDSAYFEALCFGDELILVELLDRTGPVLESLSPKTVSDILSTLVSFFLEQRYVNSVIPWIQQVVDLSSIHGPNYLALSAKARREVVFAIHEAANMEFSNSAERRTVTELSMRLRQMWGNAPEYQHMGRAGANGQGGFTGSK